jgi:hypothetical protein
MSKLESDMARLDRKLHSSGRSKKGEWHFSAKNVFHKGYKPKHKVWLGMGKEIQHNRNVANRPVIKHLKMSDGTEMRMKHNTPKIKWGRGSLFTWR